MGFDKAIGKTKISYVALARLLALASYVYHCDLSS